MISATRLSGICLAALSALSTFTATASAFVITVDGQQYDVTINSGSFNGNVVKFNAASMPWYGKASKAEAFAKAYCKQASYSSSARFYFPIRTDGSTVKGVYAPNKRCNFASTTAVPKTQVQSYATATPNP